MEVFDNGGFALAARVGRNGGRKRGEGSSLTGKKDKWQRDVGGAYFFGVGPVLALVLFSGWRQFCRVFFHKH